VALSKLRELSCHPACDALLEVDGGISSDTIGACAAAGAELYVTGTAIFSTSDYRAAIGQLHSLAAARIEALSTESN